MSSNDYWNWWLISHIDTSVFRSSGSSSKYIEEEKAIRAAVRNEGVFGYPQDAAHGPIISYDNNLLNQAILIISILVLVPSIVSYMIWPQDEEVEVGSYMGYFFGMLAMYTALCDHIYLFPQTQDLTEEKFRRFYQSQCNILNVCSLLTVLFCFLPSLCYGCDFFINGFKLVGADPYKPIDFTDYSYGWGTVFWETCLGLLTFVLMYDVWQKFDRFTYRQRWTYLQNKITAMK